MAPLRGPRPKLSLRNAFWSFLSATLGILAIYEITSLSGHSATTVFTVWVDSVIVAMLLIGSFGASAVLLFDATDSPLSQPRYLAGGHILSAGVAVIVVALFGSTPLTMAIGVGLAIFL